MNIRTPNKFQNIKHFWVVIIMNEGQIMTFYKNFVCKNVVMNFKISGYAGFTGWICNLDVIKVTGTEVEKKDENFLYKS